MADIYRLPVRITTPALCIGSPVEYQIACRSLHHNARGGPPLRSGRRSRVRPQRKEVEAVAVAECTTAKVPTIHGGNAYYPKRLSHCDDRGVDEAEAEVAVGLDQLGTPWCPQAAPWTSAYAPRTSFFAASLARSRLTVVGSARPDPPMPMRLSR